MTDRSCEPNDEGLAPDLVARLTDMRANWMALARATMIRTAPGRVETH